MAAEVEGEAGEMNGGGDTVDAIAVVADALAERSET